MKGDFFNLFKKKKQSSVPEVIVQQPAISEINEEDMLITIKEKMKTYKKVEGRSEFTGPPKYYPSAKVTK